MTNRVSPILFKSIAGALFVGVALTGCLFTDNADNINKNALNCTSLTDDFLGNSDTIIREANTMSNSSHPYWWLNSGGYLYRQHGKASTTQQKLADTDNYRLLYAKSNPTDSDDGYHPQNLIRLVTRAKFQNFTQQVFFNIDHINLSTSTNRNQSNGVLLFHRYQNGDNLYYVGLRVDGYAVIKKKLLGKYTTLKSVRVYPGKYHRDTQPNLLPLKKWLGIKTTIFTNNNGNVDISLYLSDNMNAPNWQKILQYEDNGAASARILDKGYAGIRSDFMDVHFAHYSASENAVSTPQNCVVK